MADVRFLSKALVFTGVKEEKLQGRWGLMQRGGSQGSRKGPDREG